MRAGLQSRAAPAGGASGAVGCSPPGTLSRLSALRKRCPDLGMRDIRRHKSDAGYPPWDASSGPSPIPLHCRCSFIHVFIHSFFSHIAPSPDCPPAHKGWRFLTDPREWGWGRCRVSASPSRRVCNCSGPRRPQGQSGAVPARLGRTRSSGPSRLGGLGPVSQPQDLIQSRPGRIESSCSWGRGKEAG